MTNNPEQIDLFDIPVPEGVEVLSKELSDQWQAEFYSTPIDSTVKAPKKLHPMTIAKKLHEAKAKTYPTYINNKVLKSYIGSLVLAEIADVRRNHKTNAVEIVLSVITADGEEMYACDPIGLPGIPEVYVREKMLAYLQLYPITGTPEKQARRTLKATRSLNAFYTSIRARMLSSIIKESPKRVLIEPCMSVRGNVYLKIHNPTCSQ